MQSFPFLVTFNMFLLVLNRICALFYCGWPQGSHGTLHCFISKMGLFYRMEHNVGRPVYFFPSKTKYYVRTSHRYLYCTMVRSHVWCRTRSIHRICTNFLVEYYYISFYIFKRIHVFDEYYNRNAIYTCWSRASMNGWDNWAACMNYKLHSLSFIHIDEVGKCKLLCLFF